MTLIVTMLTVILAGVSGILQYLEKIHAAEEKTKAAIESEKKQKEISDVQKELIQRSDELRNKTNELLSLNVKLRENNELVIKLQNEQKAETKRLQSPIADRFRVSFQVWFYNEKYGAILDKELKSNKTKDPFSLYPFQISDCKNDEVNKAIEDLILRINNSEVGFEFTKDKLKYRPFDLLGEMALKDLSFFTGTGNYNYTEVGASAYKYNFWLTYNLKSKCFTLNINDLPLKIMIQNSAIISIDDLDDFNVNISAINDFNYYKLNSSKAVFEPSKIEVKWITMNCGSKSVGFMAEPIFSKLTNKYVFKKFKIKK